MCDEKKSMGNRRLLPGYYEKTSAGLSLVDCLHLNPYTTVWPYVIAPKCIFNIFAHDSPTRLLQPRQPWGVLRIIKCVLYVYISNRANGPWLVLLVLVVAHTYCYQIRQHLTPMNIYCCWAIHTQAIASRMSNWIRDISFSIVNTPHTRH